LTVWRFFDISRIQVMSREGDAIPSSNTSGATASTTATSLRVVTLAPAELEVSSDRGERSGRERGYTPLLKEYARF